MDTFTKLICLIAVIRNACPARNTETFVSLQGELFLTKKDGEAQAKVVNNIINHMKSEWEWSEVEPVANEALAMLELVK